MSDVSSLKYSDIKRRGSDFTFTGKLSDFARNDTWMESYKSAIGEESDNDSLAMMWKTVYTGTEEAGNELYCSILNYVNEVGNIDTCGIDTLKKYAKTLGTTDEAVNSTIEFPVEIKGLIDILSVNRAYLYNKATDGSEDTLSIASTILHYSTIEQIIESLKDTDKFKELIHNCVYNTLMEFLNLKNVTFDDVEHGITTSEIWKTDINKFTNKLWEDDVESDDDIFAIKRKLSIDKSFTEKIYADDIIAGTRKLEDFTDSEQIVIKMEVDKRRTRYSDANSMKYYYIRLYKVIEYFRFCETVYNSVYELSEYVLDANKYTVGSLSSSANLLKYNYNGYEIDTSVVRKVSEWITDYILTVAKIRTQMKSQCQRNTMAGTKRLIIDIIRKFILDSIDSDVWNTMKSSILKTSELNKNFDVGIIQYIDTTDYTNIENDNDSVSPSEHTLHPRYWENYNDLNNAISNDEILAFFNRITDDGRKFTSNRDNGDTSDVNLYEFLSVLFDTGATSNTNSDYYLSSEVYVASDGNYLSSEESTVLSDDAKNVIAKFSGDKDIGDAPYANDKNTFHPSYEVIPFMQAFEEYSEIYSGINNLVSSYTENIKDSVSRLSKRLDKYGNTINFWYNWNDDFSGYTTTQEKINKTEDIGTFVDSPFNFNALTELLATKNEYLESLVNGTNEYYISKATGNSVLDSDEIKTEVSRIQKYYDRIAQLSSKEIYKYGKDYNGNIFILYKDSGYRNERNALGEIWVRLKNHPIAFPLFDISSSPSCFNSMSCLSETDNTKLLEVLSKVISFFDETYGMHNSDSAYLDGDVVPHNISISYGTYSSTVPVSTGSTGLSAKPSFSFTFDDMDMTENPKLVLVHTDNSALNNIINKLECGVIYDASDISIADFDSVSSTCYFVDSVTNETVSHVLTNIIVYKNASDDTSTVEDNETGKMLREPDDTYFNAVYDNDSKSFVIGSTNSVINNELLFAEYTDDNITEDNAYYYYVNTTKDDSMHPCTKHRITIKRLYKLYCDALSGYSDDSGNIHFDDFERTSESSYFSQISQHENPEKVTVSVDGGNVYEDFSKYRYKVKTSSGTEYVDYSSIVMLGGCNPYNVYYDSDRNIQLREAIIENDGSTPEIDCYEFNDSLYRTDLTSMYASSFPVSDCRINSAYDSFALRSHPYVNYYPYTVVDGVPFKDSNGGNGNPKWSIKVHNKYGDDQTFYYNLSTWNEDGVDKCIRVKSLTYNRYFSTLNATSTKFNGEFELDSNKSSEFPIYLSFNNSSVDNVATYSTYSLLQDQRKFFDMGFAYNQKMFYMSYYNDSKEYMDSGTIVGGFSDTKDDNYDTKLSFFRDTSHNLEYIDPSSITITDTSNISNSFHIGDCSTKNGVLMAYARYYNPTNDGNETQYLDILLNLVTDRDVFEHKFNIPLKYRLYEFSDGGSINSLKLTCTDSRAYISMVTVVPDDDDVISNTIDESSIGKCGSTEFSTIKDKCGDSTITILSFNIEDNEDFIYEEDEIRYIMQSGSIGYFSQFPGIDGKNNVFANEKLSADNEFRFELKMDTLDTESSDISFIDEIKCSLVKSNSPDISEPIGRFINVYPSSSVNASSAEITGIAVSENNAYGYVLTTIGESDGNGVKFYNYDSKSIYDISRGIGSGIMFFADGDNTDTRLGAFYNDTNAENYTDVNGFRKVKIPVQTTLSGYYNTDFIELEDNNENVYAFCSDRRTVAKTEIEDRGDAFIPLSGIVRYDFNPNGILASYSALTSISKADEGSIYKVTDGEGIYDDNAYFEMIGGRWNELSPSNMSDSEIIKDSSVDDRISTDGYENSAYNGNLSVFMLRKGNYLTFFGAYGTSTITIISKTQKPGDYSYSTISFTIGNIPYVCEYDRVQQSGTTRSVVYNVKRVEKDGQLTQCMTTDENGVQVNHTVVLDEADPIKGFADTTENDIKMLYTENGGVYKYTFEDNSLPLSYTFDSILEDSDLDEYDMDVIAHSTDNHIVFSYYINSSGNGGVLYARKNTPNSKAIVSKVYSDNGEELQNIHVSKILSIKKTVLLQDKITGLIYISDDDGLTFNILQESVDNKMTLVGCASNRFFARYFNNEKSTSYDGYTWSNEIGIPFSDWRVFNAHNIDYIACETYDEDISDGTVEMQKYVNVVNQYELSGDYDGFRMKGDSIVCFGGTDGTKSFRICRAESIDDEFTEFVFKYTRGFTYNRAERNGNDIVFPPDGGNIVLVVKDAFDFTSEPYVSYIDISNTVNNTVNSFGGLETVCGRLLMYPSNGDRILAYNDNASTFYNMYSFGSGKTIADMDSLDGNDDSDSVMTSKYLNSDGTITLYRTCFANRTNYGIFELDEGFPILVTYSRYDTEFTYGGTSYSIYSISFTMLNDRNRRSVTVISRPELDSDEAESVHEIIEDESVKTVVYVSGEKSICYRFRTLDSLPRFEVTKMFSNNELTSED